MTSISDLATLINVPFLIEKIEYEDKIFNLIQESGIPGGTKSRGLYILMSRYPKFKEFIYAGPATGYAQIALAYCAKLFNKKAIIYLSSAPRIGDNSLMEKAKSYGGILRKCKNLEDAQKTAKAYCSQNPKTRFLVPFGLGSEEFIEILTNQFRAANPPEISATATMWLAVGSGTILHAMLRLYPGVNFGCVIVGKNIWEDQFTHEEWARMTLYRVVDEIPFWQDTDEPPPYDSLMNYDAKVWKIVKKHGKTGDYIFNVAGA